MNAKRTKNLSDLKAWLSSLVEDNTNLPEYAEEVARLKAKGLHVYHVIKSVISVWGEEMDMISYCYIGEEDDLDSPTHFKRDFMDGYAMAYVVNLTHPDCSELGTIAFTLRNGTMKRYG